jgi:hypothetical protein
MFSIIRYSKAQRWEKMVESINDFKKSGMEEIKKILCSEGRKSDSFFIIIFLLEKAWNIFYILKGSFDNRKLLF